MIYNSLTGWTAGWFLCKKPFSAHQDDDNFNIMTWIQDLLHPCWFVPYMKVKSEKSKFVKVSCDPCHLLPSSGRTPPHMWVSSKSLLSVSSSDFTLRTTASLHAPIVHWRRPVGTHKTLNRKHKRTSKYWPDIMATALKLGGEAPLITDPAQG